MGETVDPSRRPYLWDVFLYLRLPKKTNKGKNEAPDKDKDQDHAKCSVLTDLFLNLAKDLLERTYYGQSKLSCLILFHIVCFSCIIN